MTAVSGNTLTAAQWNASVRDNLNETAPAKFTAAGQFFVSTAANAGKASTPLLAFITTVEATTSVSYTNLTTTGPTVTGTTGTTSLVAVYSVCNQNTNGSATFASYDVTGASTVAADDAWAVSYGHSGSTTSGLRATSLNLHTGLTAGSNTFTMKYRVTGGTGTYDDRRILAIPL